MAAIPSARPIAPRPSVVVAFTDTGAPIALLRVRAMSTRSPSSLGAAATTVTSALATA